jgi:hypothetical protein
VEGAWLGNARRRLGWGVLIAVHLATWEGAPQTENWYVVVMEVKQRAGSYEISQNEEDAAEQQVGKCGGGHMR